MACDHCSNCGVPPQDGLGNKYDEFLENIVQIDTQPIFDLLMEYRWTGRKGYPLESMWRAYLVMLFFKGINTVAELRIELETDPQLRRVCGFTNGKIPHRTTLFRFIERMSQHSDVVEQAMSTLTEEFRGYFPDLGKDVAIDGTTIESWYHPYHKRKGEKGFGQPTDPEASWGVKNDSRAPKGKKKYVFGYKAHIVADVNYHDWPLGLVTTTGSTSEMKMLPEVVRHTLALNPWMEPETIIADRGYDSKANNEFVLNLGIEPIIKKRNTTKPDTEWGGLFTQDGTPICNGGLPMDFIAYDGNWRRCYRCPIGGCHLKESTNGGIRHCDTVEWIDPSENRRLFGGNIRRDGPEFQALYDKRDSVERLNKKMKESRNLEGSGFRGLRMTALHALMSAIAVQATSLAHIKAGRWDSVGWMRKRVA